MKAITLRDAMVKTFTTKTNSLGRTVGRLVIDIESDNPNDDFYGINGLAKVYCTCTLTERDEQQETERPRHGED